MDLTRYIDQLQQQLRTAASAGSDEAREIASRLTAPLDSAARLVLLEALSDAAGEISAEIAPGSVDVRLRSGSPEFVVDAPATPVGTEIRAPAAVPPASTPGTDPDGGATTRTTLRLPDHLKSRVESAAAREGVSVNTWLVRAVAGALEQSTGRPAAQARAHRGTSRATGWVR
ncbi:toxin-antitoxin system HicB family antitoxin [Isoptericola halotolerans]|uniref:histidine kinase n=1 Tax=Isoptericola halotolerans TaxID=300560 RepID=UPI00388D5805